MTTSLMIIRPGPRRCARSPGSSGCRATGKRDDAEAQQEARPVELALAAEQAPAEAVDDADHGVEAVEKRHCSGTTALEKPTGET